MVLGFECQEKKKKISRSPSLQNKIKIILKITNPFLGSCFVEYRDDGDDDGTNDFESDAVVRGDVQYSRYRS